MSMRWWLYGLWLRAIPPNIIVIIIPISREVVIDKLLNFLSFHNLKRLTSINLFCNIFVGFISFRKLINWMMPDYWLNVFRLQQFKTFLKFFNFLVIRLFNFLTFLEFPFKICHFIFNFLLYNGVFLKLILGSWIACNNTRCKIGPFFLNSILDPTFHIKWIVLVESHILFGSLTSTLTEHVCSESLLLNIVRFDLFH